MADELDEILNRAQAKTDRQLCGHIEKLTRCSAEEWKRIVPAEVNRKQLQQLEAICHDATLSNEKKAEAINAIAGLTEMAVGLAAKIGR